MTNEEAQELIAEIRKDSCNRRGEVEDYILTRHAEKIITRFANKPPYVFYSRKCGKVELRRK